MIFVLVEVVKNIRIVTERQNKIKKEITKRRVKEVFLSFFLVNLEKSCTFASSYKRGEIKLLTQKQIPNGKTV